MAKDPVFLRYMPILNAPSEVEGYWVMKPMRPNPIDPQMKHSRHVAHSTISYFPFHRDVFLSMRMVL